jgi:hypothetical protein
MVLLLFIMENGIKSKGVPRTHVKKISKVLNLMINK